MDFLKKKSFLFFLMILIPIVGLLFNIYSLLLIFPLGLFLNKKTKLFLQKLLERQSLLQKFQNLF